MLKSTSAILLLLVVVSCVMGQREPGGDSWRGRVETVDAIKREITIKALVPKDNETFTGILDQTFSAKLLDDTEKEISPSEIPPGMVVKVFYKTKDERVAGQKIKLNHIYGVVFLGRDQFDKLRAFLKVPPTTLVSSTDLPMPKSNPLKLYASIKVPEWNDRLVKAVDKWNKNQAAQYGRVEFVSTFSDADLALVVYEEVIEGRMAGMTLEQRGPFVLPSAKIFLVASSGTPSLNVLWKQTSYVVTSSGTALMESVQKEIETRIRARGKV